MHGNKSPLISVVIPVYNVEKYLARCLDGVINQTYKNIEIICVNDGSPDNSAAILERYAREDSRVKIITRPNGGLSAARNSGLEAAEGEYINFVDSDDFLHPRCLEISYYFIAAHEADWVTYKFDRPLHLASKNAPVTDYRPKQYGDITRIPYKLTNNPLRLFKKNWTYTMRGYAWNRLYRRDLIGGIRFVPGIRFEDEPFILAIMKKRPKTVLLKEPLYCYIDNPRSICNEERARFTPGHIKDYHKGLVYIYGLYKDGPEKDFDFVAKEIVARKLKAQYLKIQKAGEADRPGLLRVFTEELLDLDKKNFIRFSFYPGRIGYWFKYRRMIKRAKRD